ILLNWKMPGMDGVEVVRKIQEHVVRGEIPVLPLSIIFTAFNKDQLLQEAKDVSLDAVLTKPVLASSLFDAIIRLQGGPAAKGVAPRLERCSSFEGEHILLVEDNEVNQQVARELLERAGLVVSVAGNGQEALDALKLTKFAAVLMDVQMPLMDGLETTRRIREEARFHDLPILAMTAAAMTQDREACLAAGMNDYVTKPVMAGELLDTLWKWLKPGLGNAPVCRVEAIVREAKATLQLPGFDLEEPLKRLGGNNTLLEKLLQQFGEQFTRATDEMNELVRAGRQEKAAALAHQIKGAAGNLGAIELQAAAESLERELKENGTGYGLESFNSALSRALESLSRLARPSSPESSGFECEKCRWEQSAELFKNLRALLRDNDFVPPELVTELIDSLKCQALSKKLMIFQRQVDSFDYAHALETLEGITCDKRYDFEG
ncbi:MAG: response regulator, partial [Deltaproteobacteria bacterium]|nr:response regulator [Deltaproteobacteria bacterium]